MTGTGTLPDKDRPPKSELLVRAGSAVVLAGVALGAIIASPWTFLLLVIFGGAILAWEWGSLVRGEGTDATALIQVLAVAAVALLATLGHYELALLALAAGLGSIWLMSLNGGAHPGWSLTGLLYTALPIIALVWLRSDQAYGAAAVLYVFFVAWTTDTVSYAAGRLLGGPKLAPTISPGKTWSGFVVGTLAPSLVGYAFALVIGGTSAIRLALIGVALALACQLGDLMESAVKRRFGVKDMSGIIPGHGGLFDRIDGLLLASILAGCIALRDPAHPGQALLVW